MKKIKFLLLRGLPASGKSTLAEEYVNKGYKRVNRDLLREMADFSVWSPKNEKAIIDIEKAIAAYYSHEGYNVVIDDCNLGQKHVDIWKHWAEECSKLLEKEVTVQVENIPTDVFTCTGRDAMRDDSVGRDVILKMAMEYERMPEDSKYVICDMDGTLADNKWRTKFLYDNPNGKKDWKRFHDGIPDDPVRFDVLDQVEDLTLPRNVALILVSARSEYCRGMTEEWLKRHGIRYSLLLMRGDKDGREDTLVKRDILYKYFPNKKQIIKVFDDRPSVIAMWRQEGLDVVDVGDGVPF